MPEVVWAPSPRPASDTAAVVWLIAPGNARRPDDAPAPLAAALHHRGRPIAVDEGAVERVLP